MSTATKELLVQMQINRGNATAGGSGANVMASAMISVLVTHDGVPVDDLGANVGDQNSAATLPAGWTLVDGFNVRPGGALVTVTEFLNQGGGLYDIRIVPYLDNPAAVWLSGEYLFALSIHTTRAHHGHTTHFQGAALAKLTIL
ncbi:MAG: hypothetical protein LWW79_09805 [Holophagaceae bacterium]|nr:hypothetical protein [Holophagaceae bacterium]